ncbi:SurA N-terminal domain-containing protein [Neptuniibacter halophilus]|uniref:SurA N-terminal domain-containing protein n=1 Tax=Neptuniibacter halophilus TaxID=651666 RepID=UPI002573A4C9|nr:SurA N-terminal domain-containing protein [Neptuniibacter halophilus]
MLQSIRDNSQGIIAKVIVGLIAITFALFGVESLVSLTAGSNAPATVNGEEISQQELYQGVQLQRRQMLSQMGEDADPALLDENLISNMVLEGLIEQSVLVQSAENQGLTFSDPMIDQLILATKEFQVDGRFDRAQFEATLRNVGLTPLMYRDLVRKEKVTEQERVAYLLSAFSLPGELNTLTALQNQTRDFRYFVLGADDLRSSLQVSDADVEAYFAEHSAEFMTEEQVAIEYLLLDRSALEQEITVSEQELETAYQQLVDNFQASEQRHAAHILVEVSDSRDDAAAKEKIESLAQRLQAGESFADLAQAESDDPVSAEMGGDLGVNEKGVFSEAFDDALYSLQEKGDVSAPVRTEYGYHLIQLVDVVESEVPSFAAARAGLESDLIDARSEEEYVGQLERLADISFSSGDLLEPAEALGLKIQKTELFSRVGNEAEITSNPKVLAMAFDPELINDGLNSTPIELDSGRAVVLRVVQHELPRAEELSEVADQIRALLVEEKVAEALNTQADELIARLKQGEALEAVAGGAEVIAENGVNRSGEGVAQELRTALFSMPKPADKPSYAAVDMLDGSKALVALDKVSESEETLEAEQLRFMGMMLNNRLGQQDYQDHLSQLKQKAEIERL